MLGLTDQPVLHNWLTSGSVRDTASKNKVGPSRWLHGQRHLLPSLSSTPSSLVGRSRPTLLGGHLPPREYCVVSKHTYKHNTHICNCKNMPKNQDGDSLSQDTQGQSSASTCVHMCLCPHTFEHTHRHT